MLINAQDTSKASSNGRKQTQMSLLGQISCLVPIKHHWLTPSRSREVNLELMILDH